MTSKAQFTRHQRVFRLVENHFMDSLKEVIKFKHIFYVFIYYFLCIQDYITIYHISRLYLLPCQLNTPITK